MVENFFIPIKQTVQKSLFTIAFKIGIRTTNLGKSKERKQFFFIRKF
jgi:hypothetical protein